MLLESDAQAFVDALNEDGSDTQRKYRNWLKQAMTKDIMELLAYASSPDRASMDLQQVRGTGEEAATMILGYCIGRNRVLTEMMSLDNTEQTPEQEPAEEFTTEGE